MKSEQELQNALADVRVAFSVFMSEEKENKEVSDSLLSTKVFMDVLEWVLGNNNKQVDSFLKEAVPLAKRIKRGSLNDR